MDFPPDKKISYKDSVRMRLSKEPQDWYLEIAEPPGANDFNLDSIYVLTTEKSSDRLKRFLEVNRWTGLSFIPHSGNSGSEEKIVDVIFDNYLEILDIHFSNNPESNICSICEDDVVFLNGSIRYLEYCIKELPEGWDTLSGNFSFIHKMIRVSERLIKNNWEASSMNFTIFTRGSYEKAVEKLDLRKGKNRHIDRFFFSEELGLNNYCCWPMICREFKTYSHRLDKEVDYFESLIRSEPYRYNFLNVNPEFLQVFRGKI